MARTEDSPWAVSVAQVASRPGQSKEIDATFPAPSGIGDEIVGVDEGADVSVVGSFDSIVDGLILNARISAPVHAECTRCLKPIQRDWTVNVTSFFPYEDKSAAGKGGKAGKNGKEEEVDIIAGEDEAEDTYPLLDGGAWADLEALLRDTLVEELPLQPLCKPDCKGLCSQCGIDLNENPDHQHDMTDIRFAALEGLIHSWRLSGLIMTGLFQDSFFDAVAKLGIPVVLIDSYVDDPNICCVGLEDEKGGYLATKHLLENGHRVIAFASPPISPAGVIELRLQGYRRALAEYGVPYDPALVFTQEISVQEGKKLGHQLSTRPEITGIFASADILAAGIMSGLHECGVSVPRDKSIVGFDDHYISQLAIPGLTTIHQDSEKKGTLATEMILAQLRKEEIAQKKVILPVHLVERGSVRNING